MTKTPFLNAVAATGYIFLVVSLINIVSQMQKNKPDTFLAPIAFLSVFTLSVTVMAFLFFYQPLQLFIEGKKKLAVNFFVQTMAIFAALTAVIVVLLLSGILPK